MEVLRKTKSLCPRCLELIPAEVVDDNGIVKIKKNCPAHGDFEDIYWTNSENYKQFVKFKEEGSKVDNPRTKGGRDVLMTAVYAGSIKATRFLA